ncbi:MAG: type VII toxin-antitoxin system MntA family adenylyltransferase antitoxin [Candidatus Hodarchaeales archaeon]
MMQKQIDLLKIKKEICVILEKYPVKFAYLFGSVTRGSLYPLSDIDVAVYLDPAINEYQRHRIRLKLIADFDEKYHPTPVDVVILNDAPILLKDRIIRDNQCFYNPEPVLQQKFEEETLNYALDFKIFSNKFNELQKKAILENNSDD